MADDDKSIYVGGIPYDTTEDSLQSAFDLYGSITNIRIINDKKVGGKCYAFISFLNPRAAQNAIVDMNGQTFGGRILRVNEVHNRNNNNNYAESSYYENYNERPNYQYQYNKYRDRSLGFRERDREFSFDVERERERDRDRESSFNVERERNRDRERESSFDVERERDREERESSFDVERERERERERGRVRERESSLDLERERDRERKQKGSLERESDLDESEPSDRERKRGRPLERESDKEVTKPNKGRRLKGHESGEISSLSHDDNLDSLRGILEKRISKHDDLQKKVDFMKHKIGEKKKDIFNLQKKSQKLENGLIDAQKLTSQKKLLLKKLNRTFVQFQNYTEKIKISENELKEIVNDAVMEIDKDEGKMDISPYVNGQL